MKDYIGNKKYIKGKKIHKHMKNCYLLIIFTLLFFFAASKPSNKPRNLKAVVSEISLVIQGKGKIQYLYSKYAYNPSEVLVDGKVQAKCKKNCEFKNTSNNVVIKFNEQITTCEKMFLGITKVTKINLEKFDFSKVINMNQMFRKCTNLESIIFGNINTKAVENMQYLFANCSKLTSVDLSKFETSKVKGFQYMFYQCSALKKLDLSNFNTKNVENMNCMFHKCTNLIEINLSKFDTTKVKSMLHMFCGCTQLKNLNLSSFNTKNVQNMYHMFYDCKQLQYLDISNFDISSATSIGYMFYKCSSLLYLNLYSFKYHTKLTITSLFGSVPSDLKFCIKDPTTISKLLNKKRILDCCDTCFSENPKIDLTKRICTQSKTDYKNNFCDIKNTIQIIYDSKEEEEDIPEENDEDENEKEGENVDFKEEDGIKCKEFEINKEICLNNTPEGYYFDIDEGYYRNCYHTCKKCEGPGDELNNNCIECINNCTFLNDSFYLNNCFEKCKFYYYFNFYDEYSCTINKQCPDDYPELIREKNECVEKCQNDDIYRYEYKNICYEKCPNGTLAEEDDEYICHLIDNSINYTIVKKDKKIESLKEDIMNGNMDDIINDITESKEDYVKKENDIIYQITTSENQKNNLNKNTTSLDLGDCEDRLRGIYGINKTYPLIILKIDYYSPDTLIPIIGYEIYHPINKSKLDLKYCEDILIKLNIPVTIDEKNMFKYDPNSDYYSDDCFAFTSENGTDIILSDRKKEFSENKLSLCEKNCNYTGYDTDTKQSSCNCSAKTKIDLISEIITNQDKLSNNFDPNETTGTSSGIVTLKCTKTLFTKDGLKKNISSYIIIIIIFYFTLCIMLYIKCGYPLVQNDINEIIEYQKKIKKENQNKVMSIFKGKKKKGKKGNKNRTKKTTNFPPKKLQLKFYNNIKSEKKFNNITKNPIINQKLDKPNSNLFDNNKSIKNNNFNKNTKIELTNYELNTFDYKSALENDKRTCFQYYLSLIRKKHPILFGFCPIKDYNSMIIKSSLFYLSFVIYYAINFAFINEETIHKIYENGGKYDVTYFLQSILISFAISHIISILLKIIFLSERNLLEIKKQPSLDAANNIIPKVRKNLVIK